MPVFGLGLTRGVSSSPLATPLVLLAFNSSGDGTGFASGGTAPGLVVMALKCDRHAMHAMAENAKRLSIPKLVKFRSPSSPLTLIQGGIIIKQTVYTAYAWRAYVTQAHVNPQQSTFNQLSSNGPVPNFRRRTVAVATRTAPPLLLLFPTGTSSCSRDFGAFLLCAVVVLIMYCCY